jgi:hypothetical protein
MTAKRPSLADTMRQAVQGAALPEEAAIRSAPPAAKPAAASQTKQETAARPAGFYAATRAGKKKVTAALDPTTHKRLKSLAVEKEMTTEALLAEAISDLLNKHGVSRNL